MKEKILLGGLLHDIGKFYQRAARDKINDIYPDYDKDEFKYQHSAWTYMFFNIEKVKSTLKKIPELQENLYEDTEINMFNIVNMATNHHKPQNVYDSYVTMGDWWSAGIDRHETRDLKEKAYGNINWGRDRYKTIPMYSIFNSVNRKDDKNDVCFRLKPLTLDRSDIFPKLVKEKEDGITEDDYSVQFEKFLDEFEKLPTDSINSFTETLLYLLKKYTWSIPSNTMDMADVSLYEHLKTTAAFAQSIYEYHQNNEDAFYYNDSSHRLNLRDGNYPVLLVGGDISGIQKFIYNIASSNAAKSLKGRSFYLQLVVDSIIQRIIRHKDINSSYCNVIYSSGGKFYMILPNIPEVLEALDFIKKEIEQELWKEHKGKLSVNIESVAFAYNQSKDGNINIQGEDNLHQLGDLWRLLAEKLNMGKNRKFKTVLDDSYGSMFDVIKCGGDVDICAVTGEELSGEKERLKSGEEIFVSKAVKKQIDLGSVLKDADYLITHRDTERHKFLSNRANKSGDICVTGVYNYLFDQEELINDDANFRKISSVDVSKVTRFNDTNFIVELKGKQVSYGFQFYGGNNQAQINGKNKTFSDFAKDSYLGVLRMDVDSLGNIFINGLDEKEKSFASYATMSFLLDLFFSGYINTIRNSNQFSDNVNILYSGGDDVFAVGKWDDLLEFAAELREEFQVFIGRDDISISGGMAIVRDKFPIAKAAEIAAESEESAKLYISDLYGYKNAFCFLGETISWNCEFQVVRHLKDRLNYYLQNGDLAKGFLHKIISYASIVKENEIRIKQDSYYKKDFSYKWHTAYYINRLEERLKDKD